jgi:hypothetical protein
LQEKTGLGGREQAGGGSRRAASGQKPRREIFPNKTPFFYFQSHQNKFEAKSFE